jgi:hypothetical protein
VTCTDGVHRYRKSIADAFVFLAIILYAGPPLNAPGPAVLLAALVGFLSTYRLATRREMIFTTAMAVISTFVSASLYGLLVNFFAGTVDPGLDNAVPLNTLLGPLFTLALLQYSLTTIATTWFLSFTGKFRLIHPKA